MENKQWIIVCNELPTTSPIELRNSSNTVEWCAFWEAGIINVIIAPGLGDTILMLEVLPAPFGPRIPMHSPRGTAKENPLTATLGGLPSRAGYTRLRSSQMIEYALLGLDRNSSTNSVCGCTFYLHRDELVISWRKKKRKNIIVTPMWIWARKPCYVRSVPVFHGRIFQEALTTSFENRHSQLKVSLHTLSWVLSPPSTKTDTILYFLIYRQLLLYSKSESNLNGLTLLLVKSVEWRHQIYEF